MFAGKKIVVVMPAYNASKTLEKTVAEIDRSIVDDIIVVDDSSSDDTVAIAKKLGLRTYLHRKNLGYGGNQKTCYKNALEINADIIVMLHPDYQYTPKLIPTMVTLLTSGLYDIVLASRILGGKAIEGGMPLHKFISNRILTFVQNLLTGMKLSEYHTGYRAYTKELLQVVPFKQNSDDFIFDNQLLLQAHFYDFRIAEVTCPTSYFPEASSINFARSVLYALGCLWYSFVYIAAKFGFKNSKIFQKLDRKSGHETCKTSG